MSAQRTKNPELFSKSAKSIHFHFLLKLSFPGKYFKIFLDTPYPADCTFTPCTLLPITHLSYQNRPTHTQSLRSRPKNPICYNRLQNPAATLLSCFALTDSVVTMSGKIKCLLRSRLIFCWHGIMRSTAKFMKGIMEFHRHIIDTIYEHKKTDTI